KPLVYLCCYVSQRRHTCRIRQFRTASTFCPLKVTSCRFRQVGTASTLWGSKVTRSVLRLVCEQCKREKQLNRGVSTGHHPVRRHQLDKMASLVTVRRFVAQPSRICQFDHFAETVELLL